MICISIDETNFDTCKELAGSSEMLEFRLDRCRFSEEQIADLFGSNANLVATCRPGFKDECRRIDDLVMAMRSGADFVDIELETGKKELDRILNTAREMKCGIIISHHDFEQTPDTDGLLDIISRCNEQNPDIIKIACYAKNINDCSRMLSLYNLAEKRLNIYSGGLIALSLGKLGAITRICAPYLGAPFTYASTSTGHETAAGQIDFTSLGKIFRAIGN